MTITTVLSTLALGHLAIGLWAITRGPLADPLHRFRWDLDFGLSLQRWAQEQDAPKGKPPPPPIPRWRILATWLSVHAGTLLGWPLFLPGAWRAAREQKQRLAAHAATRPMQRLANHGDGGSLECNACGYAQPLPATPPTPVEPGSDRYHRAHLRQCLSCRQLAKVYSSTDPAHLHCSCGGILSRDHLTLCPGCGSDEVKLYAPLISGSFHTGRG